MTFADGWVCQSCWKSNRAKDTRCYRCKAERGADKAAIEANRAQREVVATRRDRVPDIVSTLPAFVFGWYGRIALVAGVLLFLLSLTVIGNPDAPANTLPISLGFALGVIAAGIAMRWASGAMRSSSPLAFAVALIASVAIMGVSVAAMSALPAGTGNPVWTRYITIAVFGLSAILALVGLLFSLTADSEGPADRA
jgi:hypothetical protein